MFAVPGYREARRVLAGPDDRDVTFDLGDVILCPSSAVVRLTGTLMTQDSQAIGAALLRFKAVDSVFPVQQVKTTDSGDFSIDDIPPGRWLVDLVDRGLARVDPDMVQAPGTTNLVATLPPSIVVRFEKADGSPVAGLQAIARHSDTREPSAPIGNPSRSDGTCTLYAWNLAAVDEVEVAMVERGDWAQIGPNVLCRWGGEPVRIRVQARTAIEILALHEGTLQPVEDYAVSCRPDSDIEPRESGHHPGGRLLLNRVAPGRNLLVIVPGETSLLVSPAREVNIQEDVRDCVQVIVPSSRQLRVHVADPRDNPVRNATVELIDPRGETVTTSSFAAPIYRPRAFGPGWPRWQGPVVCSETKTDDHGIVTLPAPNVWQPLVLRVRHADHTPLLAPVGAHEWTTSLMDVVLSSGGRVSGLLFPGTATGTYRIRLCRGAESFPGIQRTVGVRQDGGFEIDHVPAGHWTVFLTQGDLVGVALGDLEVSEGLTTSACFNAEAWVPGRVSLHAFDPRGVPPRGVLQVTITSPVGWIGLRYDLEVDTSGIWHCESVVPGHYRVNLLPIAAQPSTETAGPSLCEVDVPANGWVNLPVFLTENPHRVGPAK